LDSIQPDISKRFDYLSTLDHPHIARFVGGSVITNLQKYQHPFAVFEPVYETLEHTINLRPFPSEQIKRRFITQLADALAYLSAHPQRDDWHPLFRKLDVMVTSDHEPKLVLDPFFAMRPLDGLSHTGTLLEWVCLSHFD